MIQSMRYDDTEYGIWWYRVWYMMIESTGYDDTEYGIIDPRRQVQEMQIIKRVKGNWISSQQVNKFMKNIDYCSRFNFDYKRER